LNENKTRDPRTARQDADGTHMDWAFRTVLKISKADMKEDEQGDPTPPAPVPPDGHADTHA
jgi:hypothetical protein